MKQIAIEIFKTSANAVTIILPENLDHAELLGIANAVLEQLHLPTVRLVIEQAIQPPLETA
jgi:hypothetical protein